MNNYNFVMLDEISLVSARMFNVIDNKLTLNMFIMICLVILTSLWQAIFIKPIL